MDSRHKEPVIRKAFHDITCDRTSLLFWYFVLKPSTSRPLLGCLCEVYLWTPNQRPWDFIYDSVLFRVCTMTCHCMYLYNHALSCVFKGMKSRLRIGLFHEYNHCFLFTTFLVQATHENGALHWRWPSAKRCSNIHYIHCKVCVKLFIHSQIQSLGIDD